MKTRTFLNATRLQGKYQWEMWKVRSGKTNANVDVLNNIYHCGPGGMMAQNQDAVI